MNLKKLGIIIQREYLNKVKKKSFIWTTLLVPILVAGLTVGLMVVMMNTKEKVKTIAVVDQSGIVLPYLTDTETIHYLDMSQMQLDSVKAHLADFGVDGVLSVGALDTVDAAYSGGALVCTKYEIPVDKNAKAIIRGNKAKEIYQIMVGGD